jgi:hypothetical protein
MIAGIYHRQSDSSLETKAPILLGFDRAYGPDRVGHAAEEEPIRTAPSAEPAIRIIPRKKNGFFFWLHRPNRASGGRGRNF